MRRAGLLALAVTAAGALFITPSIHPAGAGPTKRISLDATQDDPDGSSFGRSVSADGALIAYSSDATDLLADPGIDVNGARDVFVRDRAGGVNILVSVGLDGLSGSGVSPAASGSGEPAISANGRYVAFSSDATNLVPGDTNNQRDVFVRDLVSETTTLVSVGNGGQPSNGTSNVPSISADGRYVAFASLGKTLVNGDTNNVADIFVRDTQLGTTKRVNLTAGGAQSLGGASNRPSISADGSRVVYESSATNVVPGDTKGRSLVYLRDRTASTTVRVSTSTTGKVPNHSSYLAAISGDGTQVVFGSLASNLVGGDTNGLADVFAYDVATATRSLVTVGAGGAPADGPSYGRALSFDGRYVAFASDANNFDTDGPQSSSSDVFEVDRDTGDVILITSDSTGAKANGDSFKPAMSADGTILAYRSDATDVVFQSDDNGASDVYARTVSIVSVGETSVREGNDCNHTAKFVVTLSSPSSEPVTVSYATADGTATAGEDYTATTGSLTFAPMEVGKAIQVPIICDIDGEDDETFTLTLTDVDGPVALPGRVQGTGSLLDDDPSAGKFLQIGSTTIVEGDQGTRIARVPVVLSQPRAMATSFTWTTVDDSATAGDDYTASGGTVTLLPGDTAATLMIPVLPDQLQEGTESLSVVLTSADVTITVSAGSVTILDDDPV
jgi:Tol biopolymer transport system component